MTIESQFLRIPTGQIMPGTNVRLDETGLDLLAASIRKHGILQPITVVPCDDGTDRVECLFGHRRLAAARLLDLPTVPCLARPRGRPETRVLTQLAENRDRKAMSPYEEALAYDRLRDLGMTQQQIADAVGSQQSGVSARLRLLDYPDAVRRAVHGRTVGLTDALSLPLDLARTTDGRTLAAVLRRGGRHLRMWVRQQEQAGRTVERGRKRYFAVNIDAAWEGEIRAAAILTGQNVAQWASPILAAAADAQIRQSSTSTDT